MVFPLSRHLTLSLCLLANPALFSAGAPAPAPAAKAAASDTLVLPKLEVTASRAKKIDKDIKRVDKMIAREKAKVKSTDLDKALNNQKLATAAAVFGGNSAAHLSAVAASRVMLLEQERMVLEAMKRPATLAERDMMEAEIEQLRVTRRNLDDHAMQR